MRIAVALVLSAAIFGCKRAPQQFTYDLSASHLPLKVKGIELDGKLLPSAARANVYALTVGAADHVSSMASRFSVVIETTCGDETFPATSIDIGITKSDYPGGEDRERTLLRPGESLGGDVVVAWPREARLLIDRDGFAGGKLAVGSYIVSNNVLRQIITLGQCATAGDFSVDGVTVGQVVGTSIPEGAAGDGARIPDTVVDARGGHCYEYVTHTYWKKDSMRSPGAQAAGPTVLLLTGARTYSRNVDDFLTDSPDELNNPKDNLLEQRTQVRRCAITPTKPAKTKR